MLIGKLPSKEDFEAMIKKAKEVGEDQIKQIEQAAGKILQEVNKAKKEGKGQTDAFLTGLKQGETVIRNVTSDREILMRDFVAAPTDVDSLVKQLKEAANKAGLPADQAESWLRHKAQDGKIDAEALVRSKTLFSPCPTSR